MSRDSPLHTPRPPVLRYSESGRGRSFSHAQNTLRRLPVIRQLPNPLSGDSGWALTDRVSQTCMPIILRNLKNIPQIRKYSIYNSQGKCKSLSAEMQLCFRDGQPPGRFPEKPAKGRGLKRVEPTDIFLDKPLIKRYTKEAVYRGSTAKQVLKSGLTQWESTNRVRLGTKQH